MFHNLQLLPSQGRFQTVCRWLCFTKGTCKSCICKPHFQQCTSAVAATASSRLSLRQCCETTRHDLSHGSMVLAELAGRIQQTVISLVRPLICEPLTLLCVHLRQQRALGANNLANESCRTGTQQKKADASAHMPHMDSPISKQNLQELLHTATLHSQQKRGDGCAGVLLSSTTCGAVIMQVAS